MNIKNLIVDIIVCGLVLVFSVFYIAFIVFAINESKGKTAAYGVLFFVTNIFVIKKYVCGIIEELKKDLND
ncbi:MAG: hypothetical protein GY679_01840 [Mycoplasma sp.]|nr:hypothetical protein [Mycoplasma sp.]